MIMKRVGLIAILTAVIAIGVAASGRHLRPRPWLARICEGQFARGLLSEGHRAVSIPVPEYDLTNIRPGDRVDVLAVFDARMQGGWRKNVAATLLQNVMVLGVARSGGLKGKGAVTLRLDPIAAQYAALGVHQSELSLSLRPQGDRELHPMEMSDFSKLFK